MLWTTRPGEAASHVLGWLRAIDVCRCIEWDISDNPRMIDAEHTESKASRSRDLRRPV